MSSRRRESFARPRPFSAKKDLRGRFFSLGAFPFYQKVLSYFPPCGIIRDNQRAETEHEKRSRSVNLNDYGYIASNLRSVRERLAAAAARGGNPTPELIGVTKSASPEEVLALAELGLPCMAENRVQLLRERLALVSRLAVPPVFDLIGSLQTNKCKYVVGAVRLVESLDSLRLASELNRIAELRGVRQAVLVEVNSAREEAKGGLLPEEVSAFVSELSAFPALSLRGLMTMGPASRNRAELRECFRETRALCRTLAERGCFGDAVPVLSMGMSESFEIAAEEAATAVRVGRALFARDEY